MTSKAHASDFDRSGHPHDQEARLLGQLLRTARLALLYAEGGAEKTALIRRGLMPLLGRRASDELVPAVARTSGVVVPFLDRRGRSSLLTSKRRRERVVYFGDWTETPLAGLREALHLAAAAGTAEQLAPSMRLSDILDDLSRRIDAHLIILLDRFEDFLQARSPRPDHTRFANELAEAVNLPELPASFLIALNEDARPRLASLQALIPGFDDFSLKLAPPREFKAPAAPRIVNPADSPKPAPPVTIECVPVLTEVAVIASAVAEPLPPAPSESTVQLPRRPKLKVPLPRVQVRTEDVYAMIEGALSRIAATTAKAALEPSVRGSISPSQSLTLSDSGARAPGQNLQKAIDRMEQRLSTLPKHRKT